MRNANKWILLNILFLYLPGNMALAGVVPAVENLTAKPRPYGLSVSAYAIQPYRSRSREFYGNHQYLNCHWRYNYGCGGQLAVRYQKLAISIGLEWMTENTRTEWVNFGARNFVRADADYTLLLLPVSLRYTIRTYPKGNVTLSAGYCLSDAEHKPSNIKYYRPDGSYTKGGSMLYRANSVRLGLEYQRRWNSHFSGFVAVNYDLVLNNYENTRFRRNGIDNNPRIPYGYDFEADFIVCYPHFGLRFSLF